MRRLYRIEAVIILNRCVPFTQEKKTIAHTRRISAFTFSSKPHQQSFEALIRRHIGLERRNYLSLSWSPVFLIFSISSLLSIFEPEPSGSEAIGLLSSSVTMTTLFARLETEREREREREKL